MLPNLKDGQNVFVEITNPEHGGTKSNWALGKRLWTPRFNKADRRNCLVMDNVRPNDLVLHLVKSQGIYMWTGVSITESFCQEDEVGPPSPGDYDKMSPYKYVELTSYTTFDALSIDRFFEVCRDALMRILSEKKEGNFFEYNSLTEKLKIGDKYLAECDNQLYSLFSSFLTLTGTDLSEDTIFSSPNEPNYPDKFPNRQLIMTHRFIRDTALSKSVKAEKNWQCQICNKTIKLSNGNYYAEAHHIQPLGREHRGPDVRGNIIVLCPNHHLEFDYGLIGIDPKTKLIMHVEGSNEFNRKPLTSSIINVRNSFLEYHFKNIFGRVI
jgi:hypothetical protein